MQTHSHRGIALSGFNATPASNHFNLAALRVSVASRRRASAAYRRAPICSAAQSGNNAWVTPPRGGAGLSTKRPNYSLGAGGFASGAGAGAAGSAVVPRSSDGAAQSPAQSLVPLTVPTSLQPIGADGFTSSPACYPWAPRFERRQMPKTQ